MNKPLEVFIIDDHHVVREGLISSLEKEDEFHICGQADSYRQTLSIIPHVAPDIFLLDISLQDGNGFDLLELIHQNHPGIKILIISMHDEPSYVEKALKMGSNGYFSKRESLSNLSIAIRKVMNGNRYISRILMESYFDQYSNRNQMNALQLGELSRRELEIFQLMGNGLKRNEISDRLNLSVKTINTYIERIKSKLDIESASGVMQSAVNYYKMS